MEALIDGLDPAYLDEALRPPPPLPPPAIQDDTGGTETPRLEETIQKMRKSWAVPGLLEYVARGLQASFG